MARLACQAANRAQALQASFSTGGIDVTPAAAGAPHITFTYGAPGDLPVVRATAD